MSRESDPIFSEGLEWLYDVLGLNGVGSLTQHYRKKKGTHLAFPWILERNLSCVPMFSVLVGKRAHLSVY